MNDGSDPNEDRGDHVMEQEPDDISRCLEEGTGHLAGLRALRESGRISQVSLGMNCSGTNADRGGEYVCLLHRLCAYLTCLPGGLAFSEKRAENILRLIREAPDGTFDSALLAYGYNLFSQEALPVLAECEARGIEVHIAVSSTRP